MDMFYLSLSKCLTMFWAMEADVQHGENGSREACFVSQKLEQGHLIRVPGRAGF
jgi:hypothetical protein